MANEWTPNSLLAWVGENGNVLAMDDDNGVMIPLMGQACQREELDVLKSVLEDRATRTGKKIRLVRFDFVELVDETTNGE